MPQLLSDFGRVGFKPTLSFATIFCRRNRGIPRDVHPVGLASFFNGLLCRRRMPMWAGSR